MLSSRAARTRALWHLAAGLLCATLSVAAAVYVDRSEHLHDRQHFLDESARLQQQILRRFEVHEELLQGAAGLFAVSGDVDEAQWRTYMGGLDLSRHLPGLDAVAYGLQVEPADLDAHVREMRERGFEDYRVFPPGERASHVVATLIEPFNAINARAFGYDMYSHPQRRAAMDRARDEARAILTAPITLVSAHADQAVPATLMFLPVYRTRIAPMSVDARRAALSGYALVAIRIHALIETLMPVRAPGVEMAIEDLAGASLYGGETPESAEFSVEHVVEVYGRRWRLRMWSTDLLAGQPRSLAPLTLGSGLLLSLMLWALLHAAHRAEVRAAAMAREMTAALRTSEASHRAVVQSSAEGILTIDPHGIVLSFNRAAERMFGFCASEVIGRNVSMLMPERYRARHDGLVANFQRGGSRNIVDLRREVTGLRRDGEEFPMSLAIGIVDDGGAVGRLVGVIRDITESKQQQQFIRHLAEHDALTELPNRTLLQDRLEVAIAKARRESTTVGVLMVDLDHFKRINDSLGHQVGDQVLLQIATRLKTCVRECDSVARMGGDEFVVLVDGARDGDAITRIAGDIVVAVSTPMLVGGHELHLSTSVGVSCFPADGDDAATLLKNADTAMYHAKSSGRGHYQMFSAEMMRRANRKLELESAMRKALSSGQFLMHYEPQVCLRTGGLLGAEALIRWQHPERGMIPPIEFIPVAEDTGQIIAIGDWVLRTVCAEARRMQQRLGQTLAVSVNLSPRQFAQPNLGELIESACREGGLDPQFLVLEITEGTLLKRSEQILATLDRLRYLGVRIAVDDFGTGYSSLAYITRFPVDLLKIDRSFVRDIIDDPADAAIANAIIAMAHSLGIAVVAEGVETAQQLAFLRERGCDAAQGYFFGRGTPAADFRLPSRYLPSVVSDAPGSRRFAAVDGGDLF
ncbi:bifunctional diguanylate cyclase/phosphodiesterase [Sinimarinibacterium flocculans]|uniref:bifunctional diguanylate cyclase/phosphodiesterase n=1 Tax=Sinimarinibacterium flocculans TaxID=985250 RepID=UPI0035198C89